MPPKFLLDPSDIPSEVIADRDAILRANPQRHEMMQLTAITLIDAKRGLSAGYKDVTDQEFWVRGHMPDYPLMPGVIMCEAAAQLISFFCRRTGILDKGFVGFAGMDEVRFRGVVRPGHRLWLVAKTDKPVVPSKRMPFDIQGMVDGMLVVSARFLGVAMEKSDKP